MRLRLRGGVVDGGVVKVDVRQVGGRATQIRRKKRKAKIPSERCSESVCMSVYVCHYVIDSEGWIVVCSTSEEWEEAVEELSNSKRHESKQLYRYLNDVLLPDILQMLQTKVPL